MNCSHLRMIAERERSYRRVARTPLHFPTHALRVIKHAA